MIHKPATYTPHPLHCADRVYRETNCYTDVLVELLHARGLEPLAGLGHLVRSDFEGDQFTFFKMPPGDIEVLFGIDIHEMQPVGSLPEQIERQLDLGRTMIVELDSFFLPDTAATDYRRNHVKTSVAVEAIDRSGESLLYFHNCGLHGLSGADYRGVFGLDGKAAELLPPYVELVRFDAGAPLTGAELRGKALDLLRLHLERRPRANPFEAFDQRLASDLPRLLEQGPEAFHAYAFATVRMAGAAFDLLGAHIDWLLPEHDRHPFDAIVEGAQLLSFRLARRRSFDPAPTVRRMAEAWSSAMQGLDRATR